MEEENLQQLCKQYIMGVHDAMDLLNGKWKISIIAVLFYHKERRFSEILTEVKGISNKMLSKELKDLEINQLVKRKVIDKQPIAVEYSLTEYGYELQDMINSLSNWGIKHREKIIHSK